MLVCSESVWDVTCRGKVQCMRKGISVKILIWGVICWWFKSIFVFGEHILKYFRVNRTASLLSQSSRTKLRIMGTQVNECGNVIASWHLGNMSKEVTKVFCTILTNFCKSEIFSKEISNPKNKLHPLMWSVSGFQIAHTLIFFSNSK